MEGELCFNCFVGRRGLFPPQLLVLQLQRDTEREKEREREREKDRGGEGRGRQRESESACRFVWSSVKKTTMCHVSLVHRDASKWLLCCRDFLSCCSFLSQLSMKEKEKMVVVGGDTEHERCSALDGQLSGQRGR